FTPGSSGERAATLRFHERVVAAGKDGTMGERVIQEPPELVARRLALGQQLASQREAAGIVQQQIGRRTGYSRSSIAKAEAGRQLLTRDFWTTADELLKAEGELLASYEQVRAAKEEHEARSRETALAQAYAEAKARAQELRATRTPAVSSPTTLLSGSSNTVMPPWGVVSDTNSASVEPIDEAFIISLRTRMRELLALDAQVGGNETSTQALRLFRSAHRRLGVIPCPKKLQRELHATVGELAEIAGWLFYDADQQDAMRRINQEALYCLRWAGHRSLELLTLQNMSMQAEYLNRPNEALCIVQSVREVDRLSPRLDSLFLARGAHALAQQQQRSEAVRTFQKAKALYLDGPCDADPAWATWVDDRQFAWFEAMVWAELGEHDKPVHIFAEALAASPKHRVRGLYSRTVYLFESLVNVGDWREAEQLIPKLAPYISEVGSGRTANILRKTLYIVHNTGTTPTLEDGAAWLREVMEGNG
ncbi:MAG: helix-turn-helix domain-containing protein, partial [Burkholderiales bacterium]